MKIAYLISAHTDPIQLKKLVRSLYVDGKTYFFIHIDKKAKIIDFENEVSSLSFENVFFC